MTMIRLRQLLSLLFLAGLLAPPPLLAQDEEEDDPEIEIGDGTVREPEPDEALAELLDAYDRRGGGNTIPIEREILRLKAAGDCERLARYIGHHRFGGTVLWALAGPESAAQEATALRAFRSWPPDRRARAAIWLARWRTEAVRSALRQLLASKSVEGTLLRHVEAALLRAGDEAVRKKVDAALKSDRGRPDDLAQALLLAGDARALGYLDRAAHFVTSQRRLERPVRSAFQVEKRTKLPNGGQRIETSSPELGSLGEVALEAANRMVRPTTPEYIAWWYEMEKGPRFEDAAQLQAYVAAGAEGATAAVNALLAHLRQTREADTRVAIGTVSREGGWKISCTINKEEVVATVDARGNVSLPEAVHEGGAPVIDGRIAEQEWKGARRVSLGQGGEILFLRQGDAHCVAVRAPGPFIASLALQRGDKVEVLHSSASLGRAVYRRSGSAWDLDQGFVWRCRDGRTQACDREAHLREHGWVASTMGMGSREVTEFRISDRLLAGDEVRITLALFARGNTVVWPEGVRDGSTAVKLLCGNTPASLELDPADWSILGGRSTD
jgi:hypothetical protein